jgi:hypothetical protein
VETEAGSTPAALAAIERLAPMVFVDEIKEYSPEQIQPGARRVGKKWSHMWRELSPLARAAPLYKAHHTQGFLIKENRVLLNTTP